MLEALGVNTSQELRAVRDRRGARARRRALADPLGGADPAQHGHIRIGTFQRLAFFERDGQHLAKLTRYCLRHLLRRRSRGDGRAAPRLFDLVAARRRGSPPPTSPPASSTACSTATISTSPARASTMARGASRPSGTAHFTAAYFDHVGLYAFGRQPEAIHWDVPSSPAPCALIGEAAALSDRSTAGRTGSSGAGRRALRPARRRAPAEPERDVALARRRSRRRCAARTVEIDRFFFDWRGGRRRAPRRPTRPMTPSRSPLPRGDRG